ncbi:agamous-like MADS-box protein AGL90 [Ricinus communis]|uniref:MADS-box domain-containing protein n=1 Tax=Ricinus communis TaxID=3988 RepID=B9RBH7_RICCO|nr:agamous-like MADS-box protein AGL90 [Ricinus communis]EEF50898.1 conserved hypothetical protein [Ricinus communis]|eukprot:XP_002509511.1 agamous-like MADS-box protein AGL90 [Ricinus communis]
MGHSRIKMELIEKESTRMLTYQKRKKSLVKKVSEFSILCGVEACLIIFAPKHKDQPVKKLDTVWPPNSDEAKSIINKYKKTDQARCYLVSHYFLDKKKKLDVEISKLQKQVYEAIYPSWDIHLDNFSEDRLRVLLTRLESKLQVADQKLNLFQDNQNNQMDMFVPRMIYNSHNMECYMTRSDNLQVFPELMRPLDVQFPISFIRGQNPYSNFMASNKENVCSTSLQLLSDSHSTIAGRSLADMNNENNNSNSRNLQWQLFSPKSLDVQLPIDCQTKQSFQGMPLNRNLMEDVITKMSNNQNFSNQFGDRGISNIPSLSGLSYVNPQFMMPANFVQSNVDVSMPLQTMLPRPQPQVPLSSLLDQAYPSEVDKFCYGIGFLKQEHNYK